jgi:Domain of unknown function (DUF4388)/Diguanylate cyclase, GGDEF domain
MAQRKPIAGPVLKRLAHLSNVPNSSELQKMLEAASEYGQHIVQITWSLASSTAVYTLDLNVHRTPFEDHHRWVFYVGTAAENKMQWNYETADSSLIHNMLLCAFADEALAPEAHSSYAYNSPTEATTKKQPASLAPIEPPPRPAASLASRPVQAPAPTQSQSAATLILNGSLEKLRIDVLVQSLAASKLTGKILVQLSEDPGATSANIGQIYLDQGVPVHAELGNCEGEDALVELLTMRQGNFQVYEEEACMKRTVQRRLDFLLMESATLINYSAYLEAHHITADTVLSVAEARPTNKASWSDGADLTAPHLDLIDGELQTRFCALLDHQNTIADVARLLSLSKPAWTRLVYFMVERGLVRKHSGIYVPSSNNKMSAVPPTQSQTNLQDWLCNKTTGFYTHEYFRIILQHELNRYIVHRRPFAVLLIHVRKEPGPKIEACTIADRMQDITQLLRPSDFFCHYEGSSFAIVLPETDRSEARGLVKQILHLLGDPDAGHGGTGHIWLKVGAAAVPDDGESIDTMLKMAQHPDHSKVLRLQ